MKRRAPFLVVLLLIAGALYLSIRRRPEANVGPRAVLDFLAGAQREVSRLPARATRLSDAEEIAIGDELAAAHSGNSGLDDADAEMQAYVERVGRWVAARAARKLPYRFHYLPARGFINAFALPGGHVFIGAGLIQQMESEDELAAVLGHEIEHIDRRHCAERLQLEAHLRKLHLGVLGELASLPIEVFQEGYSKEEEFQADADGTRLAVAAGYSPYGAIHMFEKFQALQKETPAPARSPRQEISRVAQQTLEEYFRSHPPESERIERIRALIAAEHWNSRDVERPLGLTIPASKTGVD